MILFTCSQCGHSYDVDDTLAGKTIRCRNCKHLVRLPRGARTEPPLLTRQGVVLLVAGVLSLIAVGSGIAYLAMQGRESGQPTALSSTVTTAPIHDTPTAPANSPTDAVPKTAEEFRVRGKIRWLRGNREGAMDDVSRAIDLNQMTLVLA